MCLYYTKDQNKICKLGLNYNVNESKGFYSLSNLNSSLVSCNKDYLIFVCKLSSKETFLKHNIKHNYNIIDMIEFINYKDKPVYKDYLKKDLINLHVYNNENAYVLENNNLETISINNNDLSKTNPALISTDKYKTKLNNNCNKLFEFDDNYVNYSLDFGYNNDKLNTINSDNNNLFYFKIKDLLIKCYPELRFMLKTKKMQFKKILDEFELNNLPKYENCKLFIYLN